ncbi:hypothetical protein [Colwellia sp. MEBiC06753]
MEVICLVRIPLLCAVISLTSYFCSATESNKLYKINGFNEDYSSNVNVSGGVLTGIQYKGGANSVLPQELYIAKYPDTKSVNVKVLSVDGKYRAAFSVDFEPNENAWVNVGFSSKHQDIFSQYSPKEISVFAYSEIRSKGKKRILEVFPTSWGKPTDSAQSFLINSAGDFAKIAYRDLELGKQTSFCQPIEKKIKTSFNYSCDLNLPSTIKNNEIIITTTPNSKGKKYKIWNPNQKK